jgi:prevent-host-death family protein
LGNYPSRGFSIDIQPTIWVVKVVKTVGIFEAKTKLSSLCDEVKRSGESVTLSRRGEPLVVIAAVPPKEEKHEDIRAAIAAWEAAHPEDESGSDFPEVWKMRTGGDSEPWNASES